MEFSDQEIKRLKRGLKCTPTPEEDKIQLSTDIDDFARQLRLNHIFYNNEDEDVQNIDVDHAEPLLGNKSNFIPKTTKIDT